MPPNNGDAAVDGCYPGHSFDETRFVLPVVGVSRGGGGFDSASACVRPITMWQPYSQAEHPGKLL